MIVFIIIASCLVACEFIYIGYCAIQSYRQRKKEI